MLGALKQTKLAQFDLDLSLALITFQNLAGIEEPLISRIINDALRYANIKTLPDNSDLPRPAPVAAAAAASTIGLCHSYVNLDVCDIEEHEIPNSCVLGIEYTNTSLTVVLSPFRVARVGLDLIMVRAWDLGSKTRNDSQNYGDLVRETIQRLPRERSHKNITAIVLMGEAVLDDTFLNVMRDAFYHVLPKDAATPLLVSRYRSVTRGKFVDPTFASAICAAELAKRIMEAPDGCLERVYCKWWRKQIG